MTWTTAYGTPEQPLSNLINKENISSPQAVVGKGGIEINGNEPVQSTNPVETTLRPNDDASGGLMATVRTPSGSPVMGRVPGGKDLVLVKGMPVDLDNAANLGLVTRNADGTFSDKASPVALKDPTAEAKAQQDAKAQKEKSQEGSGGDLNLSSETTDALTKIANTVQPGDTIKAVDSILMNGEVLPGTLERMASQAGVEPEEMAEQVYAVHEGFYNSAMDILAEGGIDEDAFEAFYSSDPQTASKMTESARALIMTNDTAGLRDLASSFYERADKFMPNETRAALTQAGFEYQESADGLKVMVGGTQVSFNVAVKQGIVRFLNGKD